jgi:hypothetical protein
MSRASVREQWLQDWYGVEPADEPLATWEAIVVYSLATLSAFIALACTLVLAAFVLGVQL